MAIEATRGGAAQPAAGRTLTTSIVGHRDSPDIRISPPSFFVCARLQLTPSAADTRTAMFFSLFRRRLRRSSLAPGRYLTDGSGLFRVISHFDDGRSVLVVIEQCVTLETYACALLELEAMGFRRVRKVGTTPAVEPRASASPDPVLG
jgi:hypothetical protein